MGRKDRELTYSGTLALDSEAVSRLLREKRHPERPQPTWLRLTQAQRRGQLVLTSAMTMLEAHDPTRSPVRSWTLQGVKVVPPDLVLLQKAGDLLTKAGMHGHKYLIDAVFVATVLQHATRPAVILTTDLDDMLKLVAGEPKVKPVHIDGKTD